MNKCYYHSPALSTVGISILSPAASESGDGTSASDFSESLSESARMTFFCRRNFYNYSSFRLHGTVITQTMQQNYVSCLTATICKMKADHFSTPRLRKNWWKCRTNIMQEIRKYTARHYYTGELSHFFDTFILVHTI